jgi:hypothetical protein
MPTEQGSAVGGNADVKAAVPAEGGQPEDADGQTNPPPTPVTTTAIAPGPSPRRSAFAAATTRASCRLTNSRRKPSLVATNVASWTLSTLRERLPIDKFSKEVVGGERGRVGQTLHATMANAISARRIIFVLANSVAFLRFQIVQALMVCMKLSKRHLLGNVCVADLKSDKLRRRDRGKQLGGAVNRGTQGATGQSEVPQQYTAESVVAILKAFFGDIRLSAASVPPETPRPPISKASVDSLPHPSHPTRQTSSWTAQNI